MSKVLSELDQYSLEPNIIEKAREIYTSITSINKRGKTRKRYIFYCVYHAYLDLGLIIDQDEVAKRIGLDKSEIRASKNIAPERGSTYTASKIVLRDVIECLPTYYDEIFIDRNMLDELTIKARSIIAKAPGLNNQYPHISAALITCIFAESKGYSIDKKILAERLYNRWNFLLPLYRQINDLYWS